MAILDPAALVVRWYVGAGDRGRLGTTVLGRHVAQFYGPSDVANGLLQRHLGAATAHGRSTQHGWRLSAAGRRFWGVTDIRPLHRHDGTLLGFVHVIRPHRDPSEPVSAGFALGRAHAPAYACAAAGA
ncbi:MAG: hypothetical protein MUF07_05045 [Steroidobacteraceae bacterium]|nr:hypothetical protein [Steroidobacteraceae bacterium]